MLKISQCFKLQKKIPQVGSLRFFANKSCPMFECKRPTEEDEDEKEREESRKQNIPELFKCHPPKNPKAYRNIFFFICLPILIVYYVNFTYFEDHHLKRPKFVEFEYLRIRNKPYPWDPVRTLFHNPEVNALPTGYETEWPEEDEVDTVALARK